MHTMARPIQPRHHKIWIIPCMVWIIVNKEINENWTMALTIKLINTDNGPFLIFKPISKLEAESVSIEKINVMALSASIKIK